MAAPVNTRSLAQPNRFGNSGPSAKPLPSKPRKVRGGIKLPAHASGEVVPVSAWAAQRWLRLIEKAGTGNAPVEGLEYAREGQAKKLSVHAGHVEAIIQGRADKPYTTTLDLATFSDEDWHRVMQAMGDGAMYAAKLLAGELPASIEDVFVPLDLTLFPQSAGDVRVSCSCGTMDRPRRDNEPAGWCKHVCCAAFLLADRIAGEPFLVFSLRGLDAHELLDRLRQHRVTSGITERATSLYPVRPPENALVDTPPLDASLSEFWELGASAQELDLSLEPPAVSHPLLRRLGPSPWTGTGAAQFPLVGLLASCYDTISEDSIRRATEQESPAGEGSEPQ